MPDLITVSVTAEDLACGWETFVSPAPNERDRRGCEYCPVEHAMARVLGEEVLTNGREAWLASRSARRAGEERTVPCVVLPDDVKKKTRLIDLGLPVEPFTFEIERPR